MSGGLCDYATKIKRGNSQRGCLGQEGAGTCGTAPHLYDTPFPAMVAVSRTRKRESCPDNSACHAPVFVRLGTVFSVVPNGFVGIWPRDPAGDCLEAKTPEAGTTANRCRQGPTWNWLADAPGHRQKHWKLNFVAK